jgi:hypothetical protein
MGSYNLVTPACSIGPLMDSFSSSKVLKKTIYVNLLNAVRIRRDNKDGVLQKNTTKLELNI